MSYHFQYGGLKPEVVKSHFLLKHFEKFRRLGVCFPASSGHVGDITRQRPTPKKSNMAAGKPEVVTPTLLVKKFQQFQ